MKTIIVEIDEKSIENAIKELELYRIELKQKAELFNTELAKLGFNVLQTEVSMIDSKYLEEGLDVSVEYNNDDDLYVATLSMSGSQCAFVEFGAGVYYNTTIGSSLHPDGAKRGFTIGSYNPNSDNASKEYWYKPNGKSTNGTPTFMPMYKTFESMVADIKTVAIQVFGR